MYVSVAAVCTAVHTAVLNRQQTTVMLSFHIHRTQIKLTCSFTVSFYAVKRSGSVYQRKTGEFLGTVDITRGEPA